MGGGGGHFNTLRDYQIKEFKVLRSKTFLFIFISLNGGSIDELPLILTFLGYLSKLQGRLRFKIAQRTDHRVKLMSEIVSGIQVIKMYAWEKSFEKVVELARK